MLRNGADQNPDEECVDVVGPHHRLDKVIAEQLVEAKLRIVALHSFSPRWRDTKQGRGPENAAPILMECLGVHWIVSHDKTLQRSVRRLFCDAAELKTGKPGISAVLLDQRVVGADGDDPPGFDDDDSVGFADGRQTMRDDNGGSIPR